MDKIDFRIQIIAESSCGDITPINVNPSLLLVVIIVSQSIESELPRIDALKGCRQ